MYMKVFFDLETTSAEKDTCRIVELAIKQVDDNGNVLISKSKRYNPGVKISPSATEAHGITDEMVKDCPSFAEDAKKLKKIFETGTLIGYNIITFDIPVLYNEFERAGVDIDISRDVIDVMRLETQLSPRTLSAVYERYTGQKLDGAHQALADVEGTETVLTYQLKKIKKDQTLIDNYDAIMEKCGISKECADFGGKLKFNENGELYYTFGKHKGFTVLKNDETKQYANWIIGSPDFANQIKKYLREELKKATKQQFTHKSVNTKPGGSFFPIKQKSFFNEDPEIPVIKKDDEDLPF